MSKIRIYSRVSDSFRSKLRREKSVWQIEAWWSGYSSSNPGAQRPRGRFFTFENPGDIRIHNFSDGTDLYWKVNKIKYVPRMEIKAIDNYKSILEECLPTSQESERKEDR